MYPKYGDVPISMRIRIFSSRAAAKAPLNFIPLQLSATKTRCDILVPDRAQEHYAIHISHTPLLAVKLPFSFFPFHHFPPLHYRFHPGSRLLALDSTSSLHRRLRGLHHHPLSAPSPPPTPLRRTSLFHSRHSIFFARVRSVRVVIGQVHAMGGTGGM